MTKQVLKVEEEEDNEMRLEREENAKLYHLVAGRHLGHETCRTVAAQMSSITVLSWRVRRSPYI